MGSLIKNEITKILKKKTIYVILIITVAFAILTNCIYKFVYSNLGTMLVNDEYEVERMKESIKGLDSTKPSDVSEYIALKSDIETYELKQKYEKDSWQEYVVSTNISKVIQEKNEYIYQIDKTEQTQTLINNLEKQYSDLVDLLNNASKEDGWKTFVQMEIEETKNKIELYNQEKSLTESTMQKQEIDLAIKQLEIQLETAQMRIDKNIPYGNNYMNNALNTYEDNSVRTELSKDTKQMTYTEKQTHNNVVKEYEISKYILDTGIDVNKIETLRGTLQNIYADYGIFIIILSIIIGATIVSSEFEKGTIKLLLIKPYSRIKILLAKYITVILTVIVSILAVIIIQFIIGGLFFGFDSLKNPIVQYDFGTNKIVEIGSLANVALTSLAMLPQFILLATIAFTLSTISTSSSLSITMSLLFYIAGGILNNIAISFNVKLMKFLPTLNWDFTQYLFGGLPSMETLSLGFSIMICIAYLLLLTVASFIVFKKKNVKNI